MPINSVSHIPNQLNIGSLSSIGTELSTNFNTQLPVSSSNTLEVDTLYNTQPRSSSETAFTPGVFTVGDSGQVGIDYLFDGGACESELAIFSLTGLNYEIGSTEFVREAARRALSDSELGHIVIQDRGEGARFHSCFTWEKDFNAGIYEGVKTFSMRPGDQFGIMVVPVGTVQQVFNELDLQGAHRPLFSIAIANPEQTTHFDQVADLTGDGSVFTLEDLRVDTGSDRDYNDIVFQVRGAIGQAGLLDDYVDPRKDWRKTDLGQALIEYTRPYVSPDNPGIGEALSETTIDILNTAVNADLSLLPSTPPASHIDPALQGWISEARNKLLGLADSGSSIANSLNYAIDEFEVIAVDLVANLPTEILGNQNYMNAWLNYLDDQLAQSAQYANSWLNYLSNSTSGIQEEMNSWLTELQATISNQASDLGSGRNYLNSEISGTSQYLYDWAVYTSNETNRVLNWMQSWTDYAAAEINRVENWMVGRVNDLWRSFNDGNVGEDAWRQYDSVKNYRVSTSNDARNRYDDLVSLKNTIWDDALNTFQFWDNYRIRAIDHAWTGYIDLNRFTNQILSDAWSGYSGLDTYRDATIRAGWEQYDRTWTELSLIFANAAQQRDQLRNYIDAIINDAWWQHSGMQNYAQTVASHAQAQADLVERSWSDWINDGNALTEILAKIASSNSAWYTQPEKSLKLPLIGIIDTGFSRQNLDINGSRIRLGSDFVAKDNDPLLEPSEENEQTNHGTKILEIIAATRNNGIGSDGLNDQSPLWLGRAIGSHDWAQSLVEFVDAVKASGQPNAIVNLSFDLTQINPDGSITTRNELTALERAALTYAQQHQVLVVVPTGNQNTLGSALAQAAKEFDNVFVVGVAEGWQRADYSSYTGVDYTDYGKGLDILAQGMAENGAIGSSVAAAKVSGAASLVWAANPDLNYSQVMDILRRTATDLNAPNWDSETGLGLLNIEAAVNLAQATRPLSYRPANFDLIQETLKANAVPESSWQDFYKLYDYYNLEAKLSGTTWDGLGSAIASERAAAAWSWDGAAVGAAVGTVLGDPVTGAVVGGLLGSGSGGSGSGSSGGLSPELIREYVNHARTSISNAVPVLAQVTEETGTALSNARSFFRDLSNAFGSEIGNGDNYLTNLVNDAWTVVQSAQTTLNNAVSTTQNAVVASANALGAAGQATLDAARGIGSQVSSWVRDAWSETQNATTAVQQSLNQSWNSLQNAANEVSDKIPKSINDLKQLNNEFNTFIDANNPVKKLADDLAGQLKSTLSNVDVGAVVDVLKRIPVVGTAVSGLEGLYNLLQGDWKAVLKSAIDGALAFYGASNVVTPRLVSLFVDVSWELKDENYKGATSAALSNFGVQPRVSDVFVNTAWAIKDGDWKSALDAGLGGAGFANAKEFVSMAWDVVEGDYKDALTTGLQVAGLDKLNINQVQASAFVNSAIALRDGQVSQVADQLLSLAGNSAQAANSVWVRDLRDRDPNNDREAVTQGLTATGFSNVNQWVDIAWSVKSQDYLAALTTGFSLGGFAPGQDWIEMTRDFLNKDYLGGLSTGFQVAGFTQGESLAKAAISLRQGDPLTAFFEGLSLVDGVGELVDAFKALKDGNAKAGVPLMIQAAPKLALLIGT